MIKDKQKKASHGGSCPSLTPTTLPATVGDAISHDKAPVKPPSRVQCRRIKTSVAVALDAPELIAYQHSVLCQTSLPYRNPGSNIRVWDREQGAISLLVKAGQAKNPKTGAWIQLGLPFGPKLRLILAHLNAIALKIGSPEINVGDSLTAFVRRIQNYRPNGHQIRLSKPTWEIWLLRLSA